MLGSTSEMQRSVGLAGEAFIESGGVELVFKPMRLWFVERTRDGIPIKEEEMSVDTWGRHQDGPDWRAAQVGEWWRISRRRILRVIFRVLN